MNAEFTYTVVGGDAKFAVTSNGNVYLAGMVDREMQTIYHFVVSFEC